MRAWLWSIPPENYPVYLKTGTFAVRRVGRRALEEIRPGDVLFAYLSGTRVLAGMFEAVGRAFRDATPLVPGASYPYRLRVRPLVALSKEDWISHEAFSEDLEVVRDYPDFRAVVQQVIHPLPKVDEKVLEFLVRTRETDLGQLLSAFRAYQQARVEEDRRAVRTAAVAEAPAPYEAGSFDRAAAMEALLRYVEGRGFVYQPWEVAAYVAALRTKPFVILAGVTGTGKSKLPALVAEGTGGLARLVPVRPDWTDSAEVLGYVDLQGDFRPGAVLLAAREAAEEPGRHVVCIVDEMNLARVEQYLAEVLSRMEDRRPAERGGWESPPLLSRTLRTADAGWADVGLAPNFALAGTVNIDETTHGFSRKVLDRAFTLELTDVDLAARPEAPPAPPSSWPVAAWFPRALAPAALAGADAADRERVEAAVEVLREANAFLEPARLHVAYRTRDEVALFALHAAEIEAAFRTSSGARVDPLDLALHMKVLPRLAGGSPAVRHAVRGLLGWTVAGSAFDDDEAADLAGAWAEAGSPNAWPDARFPRTAARLCLLWERLREEGFTWFWE